MNHDKFKVVTDCLLVPSELTETQLETILGKALGDTIDSADVYLQVMQEESWSLEDGIVKDTSFSVDRGFGLRVISGEKSGFAYADDITRSALLSAASSAKSIVHTQGEGQLPVISRAKAENFYPGINPLTELADIEKVVLIQELDRYARKKDTRIKEVFIGLSGQFEAVLMMNSDGRLVTDLRPLVNLSVQVIAEQGDRRESGRAGGGARSGYGMFSANKMAYEYVDRAVRQALIALDAVPAPAGVMPVVLGPGWPAVLLHEAVGHGLEGDFNRKGSSAFSGRIGQKVASELCTIVDDGTIPGRRGSLSVDDEGTQTECTVLIEKGILKNYMQDRHNAKLMGMKPTGNGRRESYAHQPMPRMTNTYMLPGESNPEDIIRSVKKGLYAVDFAGGQVDITSGKFVFSASEAYLIEDGKIATPVKGATLIGNGPEVLKKVSMVGNDLQLDTGIGTCGKSGQSVPVGVGQPTIKVDEMTVGGVVSAGDM